MPKTKTARNSQVRQSAEVEWAYELAPRGSEEWVTEDDARSASFKAIGEHGSGRIASREKIVIRHPGSIRSELHENVKVGPWQPREQVLNQ